MKKLLVIFSILLLVSCEPAPKKGADDYSFESKEYEKTDLNIEFVILRNQREFDEASTKYANGVQGLEAFGVLVPSENRCILYIKDPEWQYVPEFIGHEVAHCIWGRWHSKRDSREAAQGFRPREL